MMTRMAIVVLSAITLSACDHPAQQSQPTATPATRPATTQPTAQQGNYICTMCEDVHSDKPGNCPHCGMALVEKK